MSLAASAECNPSSTSAPVPSAPPRALDAIVDDEPPTLPDDGSSVHPLDEWWVNALCDPLMSISELPSSIFSLETMQPSSMGNDGPGSSNMTPSEPSTSAPELLLDNMLLPEEGRADDKQCDEEWWNNAVFP